MAGRIKGITVEINGDTTKLSKALQSVDKNIKNTQTQLKAAETRPDQYGTACSETKAARSGSAGY
jgi:phage-related minor tail protein